MGTGECECECECEFEGGGLFALDVDEALFEDEGDGGIV